MTPARKAALLRLLEDWEAGRMTPIGILSRYLTTIQEFHAFDAMGWIALAAPKVKQASAHICLSPAGFMAAHEIRAGLSAARAIRETGHE